MLPLLLPYKRLPLLAYQSTLPYTHTRLTTCALKNSTLAKFVIRNENVWVGTAFPPATKDQSPNFYICSDEMTIPNAVKATDQNWNFFLLVNFGPMNKFFFAASQKQICTLCSLGKWRFLLQIVTCYQRRMCHVQNAPPMALEVIPHPDIVWRRPLFVYREPIIM